MQVFFTTNEINREDLLFEDGKHLVYFNERNIEDLVSHYLKHDDEREAIAENGYRGMCKHTFKHRATQMLVDAGFICSHDENAKHTQRDVHDVTEKHSVRQTKITLGTLTPAAESLPVSACSTFVQRTKRIFCAFPEYNAERINFFALNVWAYVIWYNWSKDLMHMTLPGKKRASHVEPSNLDKLMVHLKVPDFFLISFCAQIYSEVIKEIAHGYSYP